MRSSRRRFSLVAALVLALGAQGPLAGAASAGILPGASSSGTLAAAKIDSLFAQELNKQLTNVYYDVIVVFDKKESTSRLSVLGRKVKTYKVLPMARMLLTKAEINQVAGWPETRFIEPSRSQRLFNAEGRAMTKAEEVQRVLGLDGSGVTVAIIDTGADGLHPDLGNVKKNYAVAGALGIDPTQVYISLTPDGIDVETSVIEQHTGLLGAQWNTDEYGHGTHCIGTIAGTGMESDGNLRGMAPKANIISYATSTGINLPFTLEAYDHVIASKRDGVADIRVLSNSWGSSSYEPFNPNRSTNVASRLAYEAGILSVFAAGNDGPGPNTMNPYSNAPYALGIGATNKAYGMADFSSRGRPEGNHDRELALANLKAFMAASAEEQAAWDHAARPLGIDRPAIVAPGENIVSSQNPVHPMTTSGTFYGAASGTSMATPHVSGIAALVHQAQDVKGGARLSPLDVIRVLEVTANKEVMQGYDTFDAGAGFIDARKAVDAVTAGAIPAAVTSNDLVHFNPGPVRVDSGSYAGTATLNSFQTNTGYGLHKVTVEPGAMKLFADAQWDLEANNLYITLYAPGVDPAGGVNFAAQSAGLTTIQKYRSVEVKYPVPGEWHVRVDGRVNLLSTAYTGKYEVTVPDNVPPTAELSVSSTKVSGDQPVAINAKVGDGNGVANVTEARVTVSTSAGKVLYSFDKSAFVQQGDVLVFSKSVLLSGKAPWTVEVRAVDAGGQQAVKQVTIGRK
ncbi:S8 family serine peptidase [Massilia sp. AB1]|uniref:S8 family serine peptidase n=1 Tax=Massilia sp. AB1 TaxID=2823371 RepID=UPI001B844E1C|nr:S8 family serine peptidase [Massilia sp. AB1]